MCNITRHLGMRSQVAYHNVNSAIARAGAINEPSNILLVELRDIPRPNVFGTPRRQLAGVARAERRRSLCGA
jgi:hypothetical protein